MFERITKVISASIKPLVSVSSTYIKSSPFKKKEEEQPKKRPELKLIVNDEEKKKKKFLYRSEDEPIPEVKSDEPKKSEGNIFVQLFNQIHQMKEKGPEKKGLEIYAKSSREKEVGATSKTGVTFDEKVE
jgi:hypothetical protein